MASDDAAFSYLMHWGDVAIGMVNWDKCRADHFSSVKDGIIASRRCMKILAPSAWHDAILLEFEYEKNTALSDEKRQQIKEGFTEPGLAEAILRALENPVDEEDEKNLREKFKNDLAEKIFETAIAVCIEEGDLIGRDTMEEDDPFGFVEDSFNEIVRLIEDVPREIGDVTYQQFESAKRRVFECYLQATKREYVDNKDIRPPGLPPHLLQPPALTAGEIDEVVKRYMFDRFDLVL